MKIAICTIGSRGDIEPYLILGEYLNSKGHEVIVSSAKMYEELATKYDIQYKSFEGDYEAIADDEALKKEIGKNPFLVAKTLKNKVYPIIENSMESFFEMANWADVVIYHPKTMLDGICSGIQHKLIKAYVVPIFTATKYFTNPVLSFLHLPSFLNKISFYFNTLSFKAFSRPVKNFRLKHKLLDKNNILDTPVIYGISPSILTKPEDYPKDVYFSGFWFNEKEENLIDDNILKFLSDENKVLLITFGSMPYKSKISINDFIQAIIKNFNLKILIVRGWGLKNTEILQDKRVLAIDSAPFQSLFKKVDYIMHHGGAGTCTAALMAGKPQFICPVLYPFGDQYFWGSILEKKAVAVKPIPLKKLNIKKLIESIKKLCDEEIIDNALKMNSILSNENGLRKFLEIIEELKHK